MREQIEEMAKIIARRSKAFRNPNVAFMTTATKTSESLYNAGYHKQEWISVEERLPEDDGFVLLCTSKGAIIKGHYEHKHGRWSGLNNRLNVTHWMPLPEAPKMKGGAE